jgi:hypothetical protein
MIAIPLFDRRAWSSHQHETCRISRISASPRMQNIRDFRRAAEAARVHARSAASAAMPWDRAHACRAAPRPRRDSCNGSQPVSAGLAIPAGHSRSGWQFVRYTAREGA